MRQRLPILALTLASLWSDRALAAPECAATLSEFRSLLGDATFALTWEETTMGDGKPLVVSILERDGALFLEFIKTREGLWAQSAGVICRAGTDLEIRFDAGQVHLGPAANWVLRLALENGGKFTLSRPATDQLRIATSGWSGTFSPKIK